MQSLLDTITARLEQPKAPLVVALDGRSGAGKSTLARQIAVHFQGSLVPADDFFAVSIPDRDWDAMSPRERSEEALDWRRLRAEALEPLRSGASGRWYALDFARGPRQDGTYDLRREPTLVLPSSLVVVEGAYCSRKELLDLVDLTVLVEASEQVRRERLAAREEPGFLAQWLARWGPAEAYYFDILRPPPSFTFRVSGE